MFDSGVDRLRRRMNYLLLLKMKKLRVDSVINHERAQRQNTLLNLFDCSALE